MAQHLRSTGGSPLPDPPAADAAASTSVVTAVAATGPARLGPLCRQLAAQLPGLPCTDDAKGFIVPLLLAGNTSTVVRLPVAAAAPAAAPGAAEPSCFSSALMPLSSALQKMLHHSWILLHKVGGPHQRISSVDAH